MSNDIGIKFFYQNNTDMMGKYKSKTVEEQTLPWMSEVSIKFYEFGFNF